MSAPCSNLGESGSTVCVDYVVANLEPTMLLASSRPHDHFSIKVMGARIVLWAMDLPCHRCVSIETAVDGLVTVRRGRVLWVVGDIGRRLALMGQSICHELGARLATMCRQLQKSNMIRNYVELSVRIKKLIHIPI